MGRSKTVLPSVLVVVGLIGTGVLWEPLTGVFRQSVQFNAVGTGAFVLWGVVGVAGFVISVRAWTSDRSSFSRALLLAASVLTSVVVATWVVILATGAIGVGDPTSGSVPLQR